MDAHMNHNHEAHSAATHVGDGSFMDHDHQIHADNNHMDPSVSVQDSSTIVHAGHAAPNIHQRGHTVVFNSDWLGKPLIFEDAVLNDTTGITIF